MSAKKNLPTVSLKHWRHPCSKFLYLGHIYWTSPLLNISGENDSKEWANLLNPMLCCSVIILLLFQVDGSCASIPSSLHVYPQPHSDGVGTTSSADPPLPLISWLGRKTRIKAGKPNKHSWVFWYPWQTPNGGSLPKHTLGKYRGKSSALLVLWRSQQPD